MTPADGVHPGAYEWVREWHENDHRNWLQSVHGHGQYPKGAMLEKLRAGRPVTVRAVALPARFGGIPAPANHRAALDAEHWRHQNELREVHPDGRVVTSDEDSDIYAEYRDL